MPAFEYWDVDEILAEQHEVTIRPRHDVVGGGLLHPSGAPAAASRDLKEGSKVQVPLWLAVAFVRRHAASLDLPAIFGSAALEDLQRDASVCRAGDKSQHYFDVGLRVASLLRDEQLGEVLLAGLQQRWVEMVSLLGNMGVANVKGSPLNPGSALFPATFTDVEQEMFQGGREAEAHFRQWTDRFAASKMKASQLAEPPSAAKRQRLR